MKTFATQFKAIDPITGEITIWEGENIIAESFEAAEQYCRDYKGHLMVVGEFIGSESFEPRLGILLN